MKMKIEFKHLFLNIGMKRVKFENAYSSEQFIFHFV
jgi:hypothetical protein